MKSLEAFFLNMSYLYELNISKPKYYEKIFVFYCGYVIGKFACASPNHQAKKG